MGSVRIEIYRKHGRLNAFPGSKSSATPIQISTETTNAATPTTAGSRIAVAASSYRNLFARITTDTLGYVAIGSNPTAAKTGVGWRMMANDVLEDIPVSPGDLFSFIDN